ncbi:MAG: hypothetical protein ABIH86_01590 [Planctomycetota bacterium]
MSNRFRAAAPKTCTVAFAILSVCILLAGCGRDIPVCAQSALSYPSTRESTSLNNATAETAIRDCLAPYIDNQLSVAALPDSQLLLFALDPSQTAVSLRTEIRPLSDRLADWMRSPLIAQTVSQFDSEKAGLLSQLLPSASIDDGQPVRDLLSVSVTNDGRAMALIRSGGVRAPVYERYLFVQRGGWRCVDVELLENGRTLVEQLATMNPAFANSARLLISAERALSETDAASFERLMARAMNDTALAPAAHLIFGDYLQSIGDTGGARRCWREIIAARPFCIRAHSRLADAETDARHFLEARDLYRTLCALTGNDPFYSSLLAMTTGMAGDQLAADALFDSILREHTADDVRYVYLHRARYRAATGQTQAAKQDIDNARALGTIDDRWFESRWEFDTLRESH